MAFYKDYNIGDLVVRYCFGKYVWDMVGVIVNKRIGKSNYDNVDVTYYTIQWGAFGQHNSSADTWQAHEFDLIEDVKKVEKNT